MKIKIFVAQLLINIIFTATPLFGQSFSIMGTLQDNNSKDPLIGGHVYAKNEATNEEVYAISEIDGSFILTELAAGDYKIIVSYIGYNPVNKEVTIVDQNVNLGTLTFRFNSETLTQAEVAALQQRAVTLGDTTQYNADTYVTNPDANAEDLLQKMPGFVVTDGTLAAQGETVTKVLVDGKPFFGDDPNTTLKNMPAEVIAKIQVFDEESEESKATGFSDGNTTKTVNIILKEKYKNGKFGSFYAGYGYDNKYNFNGNLNIFDGDRRISIVGQSNNINIQNFSSADLLGISANNSNNGGGQGRGRRRGGPGGSGSLSSNTSDFLVAQQGGISSTNAIGLNYQDKWGEKLEVVGSYFFNHSDNNNEISTLEEYFGLEAPYVYQELSESDSRNLNHRANLQLRYNFNKNTSLLLRPSLTIQQNEGKSSSEAQAFSSDALTNVLQEISESDLNALKFSNELFFNHRFEKRGRSISFRIENELNTDNGNKFLLSENLNFISADTTLLNQTSTLDNTTNTLSAGFRYTEPIGEKGGLMLGYTYGNERNEADVLTFDYNEETQDFDVLNSPLSNTFSNDYWSHRGEVGYRMRDGDFSMMLRAGVQTANLKNEQIFPIDLTTDRNYTNILPSAHLRYRFSREKNIRLSYRSSTQLPDASDLQEVVDNSNPLQLTVGNANLDQQVNHRVNIRYSANSAEKATVFFGYLQLNFVKDYIGQNTFIADGEESINGVTLQDGVQVTRPVNLSGNISSRAFVTYGIPLAKLKSNFNMNLGGSFSHTPSQVDSRTIFTNNQNANVGLTLSSNISPKVDFTIGTTSNIDFAQGENVSQSSVFYQQTNVKMNYIFAEGWRVQSNLTHNYYESTNDNFMFWNASVGRKFLQDDRAEIMLSVYDILNSNTAVQQTYTDNAFTQTTSLALQRFFMLGFKYNLRAFDAAKATK